MLRNDVHVPVELTVRFDACPKPSVCFVVLQQKNWLHQNPDETN